MAAEELWTVKGALDWTRVYLSQKGDENPRLAAEWLLGYATGLSRIELYTNYDRPLSAEERSLLHDYVARRAQGEPLQYITGEVGFRHISVKVRPGVLIPRPETEVLVSIALELLPEPNHSWQQALAESEAFLTTLEEDYKKIEAGEVSESNPNTLSMDSASTILRETEGAAGSDNHTVSEEGSSANVASGQEALRVIDLCTGSGCIACSLAYEHPQVSVIATDISPVAVGLAQENASNLGLSERVAVLCCDLAEKIPERLMGTFDLVVSNPPYIPTAVLASLDSQVRDFEPTLALDGGEDGNDFLRRILPWAMQALKPGGAFALELHETCLEIAKTYAEDLGFTDVCITKDLVGKHRVLSGRK